MSRVVLAMSGGVDSSVAAWLLREQGHEVIGLFMRHGIATETECESEGVSLEDRHPTRTQGCCSESDANDARRVAERLEIPFYALNFELEFDRIVDYFVREYTSGRTPNPCIVCNTWLKFGKLFEYANSMGAEYVATGHYARLVSDEATSIPSLLRGRDLEKDQSYVLFGVRRELLSRLLFPVGARHKAEIREIANRLGFQNAQKPDSQEICFVADGDHSRLVRQRGGLDTSGQIVTSSGTVVGRHDGIEGFTIGQRKGLGIAFGERRFVIRIEPETFRVVVGSREELGRTDLFARESNWLVSDAMFSVERVFRGRVKIRYRSPAYDALIEPLPNNRFHIQFDEPCYGIAPGQAAVCYTDDRVLGGGWIE